MVLQVVRLRLEPPFAALQKTRRRQRHAFGQVASDACHGLLVRLRHRITFPQQGSTSQRGIQRERGSSPPYVYAGKLSATFKLDDPRLQAEESGICPLEFASCFRHPGGSPNPGDPGTRIQNEPGCRQEFYPERDRRTGMTKRSPKAGNFQTIPRNELLTPAGGNDT